MTRFLEALLIAAIVATGVAAIAVMAHGFGALLLAALKLTRLFHG